MRSLLSLDSGLGLDELRITFTVIISGDSKFFIFLFPSKRNFRSQFNQLVYISVFLLLTFWFSIISLLRFGESFKKESFLVNQQNPKLWCLQRKSPANRNNSKGLWFSMVNVRLLLCLQIKTLLHVNKQTNNIFAVNKNLVWLSFRYSWIDFKEICLSESFNVRSKTFRSLFNHFSCWTNTFEIGEGSK